MAVLLITIHPSHACTCVQFECREAVLYFNDFINMLCIQLIKHSFAARKRIIKKKKVPKTPGLDKVKNTEKYTRILSGRIVHILLWRTLRSHFSYTTLKYSQVAIESQIAIVKFGYTFMNWRSVHQCNNIYLLLVSFAICGLGWSAHYLSLSVMLVVSSSDSWNMFRSSFLWQ